MSLSCDDERAWPIRVFSSRFRTVVIACDAAWLNPVGNGCVRPPPCADADQLPGLAIASANRAAAHSTMVIIPPLRSLRPVRGIIARTTRCTMATTRAFAAANVAIDGNGAPSGMAASAASVSVGAAAKLMSRVSVASVAASGNERLEPVSTR